MAIEIVIHLHNDDSVAAADELNTAFGCVQCYHYYIHKVNLFSRVGCLVFPSQILLQFCRHWWNHTEKRMRKHLIDPVMTVFSGQWTMK